MFITTHTIKGSYKENQYTPETGFGFWVPEMASNQSGIDHEQALKSGGWNRRHFYQTVSEPDRQVLIIKASVPDFGTYKVSLKLGAVRQTIENLTLFSSRRAMIARDITVEAGKAYEKSWHVAVTPFIPPLSSQRCLDRDIFISFSGKGVCPAGCSDEKPVYSAGNAAGSDLDISNLTIDVVIEKETVPVIWIGGDSTVTDQNAGIPYYPFGSFSGWAQTLPRYIKGAAVCNLSHSGLTSNCFRDDGHYQILLDMIKPGDLAIFQFGHNDQKRRNLGAFGGYADNLRRYTCEIRQKGGEVILCSPISRIPLELSADEAASLSMDRHYSLLADYARAVKTVACEMDVPFVDLHQLTFDKWIELGDKAKEFFMPGDVTHTNEYGSVMIADMFMSVVRNSFDGRQAADNGQGIATGKAADCSHTLVDRCDNALAAAFFSPDSDTKVIPSQEPEPDIFAIKPPYVDIEGHPLFDEISKAFRYCLLDPCVMHLHPDSPMPRAQLLMVLFKALRIAGSRPYTGRFADIRTDEWDSGYVQTLIKENLIDPRTIREDHGRLFFRPDDDLTFEELDSFLMRFYESNPDKRDISLAECVEKARSLSIDRRDEPVSGKALTRAEVYAMLARFIDLEAGIQTRSINFEA